MQTKYLVRLVLLSILILFSQPTYTSAGDIFLQGNYVEVGIHNAGSFGTSGTAPAGFHPKVSGNKLGFVADPGRDGWTVGNPPQTGDYFVPGSPEEGWMVQWTNSSGIKRPFHNFGLMSEQDVPTTSMQNTSAGLRRSAVWEGVASASNNTERLRIVQSVSFDVNALFFSINVVMTNTGSTTLRNLLYMRNVDPDQEAPITGNYTTRNWVEYQPPRVGISGRPNLLARPSDNVKKALTIAEGLTYRFTLGLGTIDPRAVVAAGHGFSNRDVDSVLNNPNQPTSVNPSVTDAAIVLAYELGDLAPGQSASITYAYILNKADLELAMGSLEALTILQPSGTASGTDVLFYATTNQITHTARVDFYLNETYIGSDTSPDSGGIFEAKFDSTKFPKGTASLRVVASFDDGSTVEKVSSVAIDNTGPPIAFTKPVQGQVLWGTGIPVTVNTLDPNHLPTRVSFFRETAILGSQFLNEDMSQPFEASFAVNDLPPGTTVVIKAVATDGQNNVTGLAISGVTNRVPKADAGPDQTVPCVNGSAVVTLDGSSSSDLDGDEITYTWTGSFGTITGVKPTVTLGLGTHFITLSVVDTKGYSSTDTIVVKVTDSAPPVVDAGPDVVLEALTAAGASYTLKPTAIDSCCTVAINMSPQLSVYPIGSTDVVVSASDCASNYASDTVTVTVKDTTPPSISSSIPANGSVVTNADAIVIGLSDMAAGVDLLQSLADAVVKDDSGNRMLGEWKVKDGNIVFTPVPSLLDGDYSVTIYPTDTLGNKGIGMFGFTLDRIPPTIQVFQMNPLSPHKAEPVTFKLTFSEKVNQTVLPSVTIIKSNASPGTGLIVTGHWTSSTTWEGSFPFTTSSGDGFWDVRVRDVRDLAGNVMSEYEQKEAFVLDTLPPLAPVVTSSLLPTKSGTVTLEGTKEANTVLSLNNKLTSLSVEKSEWKLDVNLTEGKNDFTLSATDMAGNTSISTSVSIVRDNAAPKIESTSPANNSSVSDTKAIMITLTDLNSGVQGSGVDLGSSMTGAVVKREAQLVLGTWDFTSGTSLAFIPQNSFLEDGTYVVTLYPVDFLGNKGFGTLTFTVDTILPSVLSATMTPTSPHKAEMITFKILFNEEMDTSVQPTVNMIRLGTIFDTTYSLSGTWLADKKTWQGTYTFTPSIGDGTYNIKVTGAKDRAQNQMAEYLFSNAFVLDTAAPDVPTIKAVTTPTKAATQVLSGTKEASTALIINGQQRIARNAETSWSYSYPLSEGSNTLNVLARDEAGNDSPAISPAPVIVLDTTPPQFTIDSYTNPSNSATQTISGRKEPGCLVKLNGSEFISSSDQGSTWSREITLTEGMTNHLVFTASDSLGNTTTRTIDILYDSAPPAALSSGMLAANGSGTGSTVTLSWPSYIEPADLAYYRIYVSTSPITSLAGLTPLATTVNKGTKTFTVTGLTAGTTYYFVIVPVDGSGNYETTINFASAAPNDTAPPEEVTGLAAWAGHSAADGNYVTLTWTASKNTSGDLADQILYVDSGNGYDAGTSIGAAVTTHTVKQLADAKLYRFKIAVKDTLDHLSSGVSVQAMTRLANPTGLKGTAGNQKAILSWNAVSSTYVKLYNIYRKKIASPVTDVSGMTLIRSQSGTGYTDTGLENGATYQYAVTVVNTSGAERTDIQSIAVIPQSDTVGPVLANVTVTANQVISAPFTISATATDAESTVAKLEIWLDGILVKTQTGAAISHLWNVVETTDGNHTVTIKAYDSLNNVTELAVPVVVSLALPATPTITGHTFTQTTPTRVVSITGTAPISTTIVTRLNGVVIGQPVAVNSNGEFTVTGLSLVEGDNLIAVKAVHRGGESPFTPDYKITVDTGAPPAPVSLVGKPQAGGTIQFSWQAGVGEVPAGFNLYMSAGSFTSTTATGVVKTNSSPIVYALRDYIPADDNRRFYAVTAVDSAGNESGISNVIEVAADRSTPAISQILFTKGDGQTPTDNIYGPGTVKVSFSVSEALKEQPFFSLEPQSGSPIVVTLRQVEATRYEGNFAVDGTSPHGALVYRFSGKDIVGNRGTQSGPAITLDVKGPAATIAAPVTLLKTSDGPAVVSVVFDENSTTTPSLELRDVNGATVPVTGLVSSDTGIHWSGTVDASTLADGKGTFILLSANDRFGNNGATVASGASIVLYKNAPAPPAVPENLAATSLKGGSVKLSWQRVMDAQGYIIYRQGEADQVPVAVNTISDGAVVTWTDTPAADGSYSYSISSFGLLSSESVKSAEVIAVSDRTPPAAPTGLALEMTGNGLKASWQGVQVAGDVPVEVPAAYRLYRNDGVIVTISSLTPVAAVNTTTATDPAPIKSKRYYAVTSLDSLGNESAPSATVDIDFPVAPPATLTVSRVDDAKPTLSWSATSGIQGYYIYRNGRRVNDVLTVGTTYTDSYYAGDAVTYGISVVDSLGNESPRREATLPPLTVSLKDGTVLRRGVLENVALMATLIGQTSDPSPPAGEGQGEGVIIDTLSVKIGNLPQSVLPGPFSITAGTPFEVSKVAATEANAPPQVAVITTAELRPASGTTITISRSSLASVIGSGTALEVFNEPLVRGTNGSVRIKVNNLGTARMELVTSQNNGPSSQVKIFLRDQDGNLLAQGALNQRTGSVVNSGSYATARIEPGQSFLSDPIAINVPSTAPYKVIIEAVIESTYYHYNQPDQVTAPGLRLSTEATIADVSYMASATTNKAVYRQGEPVVISGTAISTATNQPMPLVPVKIGVSVNGFDRFFTATTGDNGSFSYTFTPGSNEAGSYSIWAVHPDLSDRTIQAQFSIIGMSVSPTLANVRILKGKSYDIPVTLRNLGGSPLTGLSFTTTASSGITANLVNGGDNQLTAGETQSVTFRVTAAENAPDTGYATVNIATTEGLTDRIVANVSLVTAIPQIATTPSYIDTGIVRERQRVENFTIKNTGMAPLTNARVEGPSLLWLSLAVDRNLGSIAVNESKTVGILMSPGATVQQGVYNDRIVVYSDNHIPYTYNIQVTVTSNAVGSVQFYILNELNEKVPNATITVQNQAVTELVYTVKSSASGNEPSLTDIPEGRYTYSISAPNHKSATGSFVVIPGVWITAAMVMEFNLVNIEWSVTPVVIEDKYQITINQTFVTNVPAPVLVTEPPGVTLPEMAPGQVYNGEFTVTNYGLVALRNFRIGFPTSIADYDIEILATIPTTMSAMQKITVPYRVTRRQPVTTALLQQNGSSVASIFNDLTSYGGSCYVSPSVTLMGDYDPCETIQQTVSKMTSHTINIPSLCPSGVSSGSIYTPPPQQYTGGGPGIPSGQAGGGGWAPAAMPALLDDGDECGSENPPCDSSVPGSVCPTQCTNSTVNLGSGTYEDTQVDIEIKTNGIPVAFERNYSSRWTPIGVPSRQPVILKGFDKVIVSSGGGGGCGGNSSPARKGKSSCSVLLDMPRPMPPPQAFGWTSPWFAKVQDHGTYLAYFNGYGQIIYFTRTPDNTYIPAAGAEKYVAEKGYQVTAVPFGYKIKDKKGEEKYFTLMKEGSWYVLSAVKDNHDNQLTFRYDNDENLLWIEDATGVPVVHFVYENGYISKLVDRDGREVNYRTDSAGRLVEVTGVQSEKTTYEYDALNSFNRLKKKVDPEGHVTSIEYKPGQLVVSKVTEPGGGVRSFAYDFKNFTFYSTDTRGNTSVFKINRDGKVTSITKNGRVLKKIDYPSDRAQIITDEAGNTTRIDFNEVRDPVRVIDGEGNQTRIDYNQYWKVSRITDPLGNVASFQYNDKQDLVAIIDPAGIQSTFEYDRFGNVTKAMRGQGENARVVLFEYDSRGNITKSTDPLGNETTYGYDSYGHLNRVTDANDHVTTITNDLIGRPLVIENPLGGRKTVTYDKKGNVTSVTDELGRKTSFTYDFKGRVTSATDPDGKKTILTYDGEGNLVQRKELAGTPDERITTYTYDIFNRVETATDPLGNVTRYGYSGTAGCSTCGGSTSSPSRITDPLGNITDVIFDRAGRITGIKDPLQNITSRILDPLGRITRLIDANGKGTSYTYDSLGRVTRQTDANGGVTSFAYNAFGDLTSLSDAKGNTTRFEYDLTGRKVKEIRPMGQAIEYSYYPNGLLKTIKDAKGQVTTYTYDAADRLTEIAYADGKKDTFTYDAAGNMLSYSSNGVSGAITYDNFNRRVSETVNFGAFSKTFNYSYNPTGTKASFTSPEGVSYAYSYNKNNQLTAINFEGKSIGLNYQWDRLIKATLPNGVTTDYQYNANSWLSFINTKTSTADLLRNQYSFDKVGNITGKTAIEGSHSYSYDPTYQLTQAISPTLPAEAFSYDAVGNRLSAAGTLGSWSYNASNELTGFDNTSFSYDSNGNATSKIANGQTMTFGYNATNRLETVQLPDGRTATYGYDPFGRRIKKDVAGEVTYFLYSEEGLIGEYDTTGNLKKSYGWMLDGIWGTNPVFMREGGQYYIYHNDDLGTPQKMTDMSGRVVWSAEYTAFGQAIIEPASTVTNNLRLPGHYFDEETGLHYNYQRYYDPKIGRYIQLDPIGFAAMDENLYRYVHNNPYNAFDPYGLYDFGDFAYDASNVLIALGDTISLGLTVKIRQMMGTDDAVNKCSGAYKAGEILGDAWWIAFGAVTTYGGASLERLGRLKKPLQFIRDEIFRWEKNAFKLKGVFKERWHFHLGPNPPMNKYHLPFQWKPWFYETKAVIKRNIERLF